MPDREPWVKFRIGFRRSGKVANLPSDTARLGWVYTLLEAKTQRRLGVFDNAAHFDEVLGRFGRFLPAYLAAGLLHEAPALCGDCAVIHTVTNNGELIVHDYLREQRDATHADRQAAYRERQSRTNEPSSASQRPATVTADVTKRDESVTVEVTSSHARAGGQGQRQRTTPPTPPRAGGRRTNGSTRRTDYDALANRGRSADDVVELPDWLKGKEGTA